MSTDPMSNPSNILQFSRTYELGTKARDVLERFGAEDMQYRIDKTGVTAPDGKEVIFGFWWRGYIADNDKLAACKVAMEQEGVPAFES